MMLYNDPNRIGSDAWRARHAGAEAPTPMTIVGSSARDQLNQPTSAAAPPASSFESEAHAELVRIARSYNEHLDRTDRDAVDPTTGKIELDAKLKAAHSEFANTGDAKGIGTVEQLVDERVADAKRKRDEVRKSLVVQGDTAAEIRATRRWESDRNLLDSKGGSLEAGRKLLEAADGAELSTLLEELPGYYAARGVDPSPIIEATLSQKCPEIAEADREARRTEQNAAVIRADAQRLRTNIASGTKVRVESLVNPATCRHNT
jgi:hypothetical protein